MINDSINPEDVVFKFNLTNNQILFEVVHWIEMVYMYYVTKQLTQIEHSQLNIKNELMLASFCWVGFSLVFFFTGLEIQEQD